MSADYSQRCQQCWFFKIHLHVSADRIVSCDSSDNDYYLSCSWLWLWLLMCNVDGYDHDGDYNF